MQGGYQRGLARSDWPRDHDQSHQLSTLQFCGGESI
jgi:hypothetical protein